MNENLRASVRWTFKVVGPESADELSDSAERVMDALLDLEACDPRLCDAGVAMDADAMTVDVELTVTGPTAPGNLEHAQTAIRAAIHAAGDATPDWPNEPFSPGGEPAVVPRHTAGEYHQKEIEMLAS
ncbi:hypothetical protein OG500_29465 [Kitasatospora sp. NBC_01250]|uniref:hypothetical protein n=1 Tax=unclassified Kitasatospora TaxID=2633591 RepID=UPI002E103317|nr:MULTISPECIES: hypothetical protein [unclassified Kitasatospora]WSJ70178.1 hypothetical protein OG294_31030 [Kitasatospora sp. NBC_01302]